MPIKKPMLLVGALLAMSSCHKALKPEITTTFDTHFELHSKVKQLREIYRGGKFDTSLHPKNIFQILIAYLNQNSDICKLF